MWDCAVWLCQSSGSAWESSIVRIDSYSENGPPCGLLEQKYVDSIGELLYRLRLGTRHGVEGFLYERCVLSKIPLPSPPINMQYIN